MLFPVPVGPTRARVRPAGTTKERSSWTGAPASYAKLTRSIVMADRSGATSTTPEDAHDLGVERISRRRARLAADLASIVDIRLSSRIGA